jgi:hypothetical protein
MCPKIDVMERECKNYNICNASKRGLAKHKRQATLADSLVASNNGDQII